MPPLLIVRSKEKILETLLSVLSNFLLLTKNCWHILWLPSNLWFHVLIFYFFTQTIIAHASAVFFKHWQVTSKGPINNKHFCYPETTNIRRKVFMYPWRINFWMQKHSETSKGHPQYIFVVGKNFLHLSVLSFSLFLLNKFFPSKFSSGQVKCSFEKSAENILPENPCFFTQWTKRNGNFSFSWNSHFLKLLFWTQKTKFWHPFWKNFDKMQGSFR